MLLYSEWLLAPILCERLPDLLIQEHPRALLVLHTVVVKAPLAGTDTTFIDETIAVVVEAVAAFNERRYR